MPDCIVELKSRPRDRVTVTLSGGRFFTIPAERARALMRGQELGNGEVDQLDRVDQYLRGRDKVLRLLAVRARTRYELRVALDGQRVSPPVRDGLLDELVESGLVDDERFAREYVHARADERWMGPHRLRFELKKRGVNRAIVEDVLAAELPAERQESLARELVARKVPVGTAGAVDERTVRRVAGMLRRKGYDYEIVNRISYELLRRVGEDADVD
jgi:regulatory protein